jgi:hypothetical protein
MCANKVVELSILESVQFNVCTEVDNVDLAIFHSEVVRLNISVHYAMLVEGLDRVKHFHCYSLGFMTILC